MEIDIPALSETTMVIVSDCADRMVEIEEGVEDARENLAVTRMLALAGIQFDVPAANGNDSLANRLLNVVIGKVLSGRRCQCDARGGMSPIVHDLHGKGNCGRHHLSTSEDKLCSWCHDATAVA